ncbi:MULTISPECIES: hypothetical protein [unclassified Acinetobacter]|jgi:hypothetical protein|uniref:hypothetical protein n=1 Tax=unclassified Acinetobacter TaxID=196816 RepID=UPI00140ACB78|nr:MULTISPECIES: hypothetical protein [unclassified Acinetobacter]MCG2609556.1 hypothetical protein [Acinetobacter sp. SM34]
MPIKFVIRFTSILVSLLILAALVNQFFFSSQVTIDVWILSFPIIVGVPIFASIISATDNELNQSH